MKFLGKLLIASLLFFVQIGFSCIVQVDATDPVLIITDFQVSPTKIHLGETFTFSGQVVNVGSYSAVYVSLMYFFENIENRSTWYSPFLREMPTERRIDEFKPGQVWNFTLTLRAMSVDSFDIGIYFTYAKSLPSQPTEVKSGTVRVEVSRVPPQIPSWLNWWTVVILTTMIAVIGWRLKWLGRLKREWKTLVMVVIVMVAIGSIVYVVLLNSLWTPVMILGAPLIVILLGFVSKNAIASFLAPIIPTIAVTSAIEMLNLMTQYYSPGKLMFIFTLFSLSWGLIGSGVALRRQGREVGISLLAIGLLAWIIVWLSALGSG